MKLVDFYGCSFVTLILAIIELVTIGWIYGVPRLCKDIKFMLGFNPNLYWRICWRYLVGKFAFWWENLNKNEINFQTPGIMIFIFVYDLLNFKKITFDGYVYPDIVYTIGWFISFMGLISLPIFAFFAIKSQEGDTLWKVG